jgi:putative ABC transport system permease protein
MTRPQLVVKNLFRNPRRTFLTTASVAAFFFLFTILLASYNFISSPSGGDPRIARVLIVASRVSPTQIPVPMSYWQRIAKIPGVEGVTPFVTFDAHYGGEDAFMVAFPTDPEVFLKIFPDMRMPEEQRHAYVQEKTALLAGRKAVQEHGWKLGDHISLSSPGHRVTMDLVLRAIYTAEGGDESILAFHWDYFNDLWPHKDHGALFWVVAKSIEDTPRVMQEIDATFHNADVETMTQTMMQFSLDFFAGLGKVKLMLLGISAAVVFATLLIVANSMAMSIRERTVELAVLRALGFRSPQLLGLLTAESVVISLTGAGAGCLTTWLLFKLIAGYRLAGWIPIFIPISFETAATVIGVAIGISLVSTLIPALRAAQTNIAQALRFVG